MQHIRKSGAFVKIRVFHENEEDNNEISEINVLKNEQDPRSELIFFTSPYSSLGFKIETHLSEIIAEKGLPIKVTKIDVTLYPEAAEEYDIVATPTLIFQELRACGHYEQDTLEEFLISHCFFEN